MKSVNKKKGGGGGQQRTENYMNSKSQGSGQVIIQGNIIEQKLRNN